MPSQSMSINDPSRISIARHPIFDVNRHLWGYRLSCLCGATSTLSGLPEEDGTALKVAVGASMGLQHILSRDKKVVIDFNEKSILTHLPYVLPAAQTAVHVAEDLYRQTTVREALSELKSDGYLITVGGYSAQPDLDPFYRLANIISLEVQGMSREALETLMATIKPYKAKLMAWRVDDEPAFRLCKELGFSFFHGAFFKSPEIVTVRPLSSSITARFNLLKMIETDEPDIREMAEVIQSDVSISFRLFAYLNSAAFGLSQKVKSILHAITLLGWRNTKNWLRVVLLNDVNRGENAPELFMLAVQRGKFLERIAKDHDYWGFNPESLQLMGLFSLLDAMLSAPMKEIVSFLPLEDKIKAALMGETNNEYQPLLRLAKYFEEGRWAEADVLIQQLNLNRDKVKAALQAAIDWAGELSSMDGAGAGDRR